MLKKDDGSNKQHFIAIQPNDWMEKLFPFKEHNKLHLDQWKALKGIDLPENLSHLQNANWLYMTINPNMRTENASKKLGGCGAIHFCHKCEDAACYKHFPESEPMDCSTLDYGWFCSCDFDENDDSKKIAVRGTFQGAIPSYLCCNNTNPSLNKSNLEYLTSLKEYISELKKEYS